MMDIFKSTAESSSIGQEDGDGATGSERPLKKARFAWQVKGKYHLKNETDESNKNLTRSTEPSTSELSSTSQGSSSTLTNKVENCLIKQDYSNLDSVIYSDNSLLTTINNLTTEQQKYPRYVSTYERESKNVLKSKCCNNVKSVSMPDNAEDLCIAQWQAKQLRKGCLDNTVNRALESMTTDPVTEEANSRVFALNFAEFINHLPGDNSVENEGILMAISAHGLQNTPSSSSNDASYADNCSIASVYAFDTPSRSPCLSPVAYDSEDTNVQLCETDDKEWNEILDWQTDNQNAIDSTPFEFLSEPARSPSTNFYHDNHQNLNTDSLDIDSHFDFMNAAVLYAIKSKGLTASGTEYG